MEEGGGEWRWRQGQPSPQARQGSGPDPQAPPWNPAQAAPVYAYPAAAHPYQLAQWEALAQQFAGMSMDPAAAGQSMPAGWDPRMASVYHAAYAAALAAHQRQAPAQSQPGRGGGRRGKGKARKEAASALEEKYGSVEACKGKIGELAREQEGCRFLQRKLEEGGAEAVEACLEEALEEAPELMRDPFANYLLQKLCDLCDDEQRERIFRAVARPRGDGRTEAVACGLDAHGTRALQKLVESITTREHARLCAEALETGCLPLMRDLNGHHVLQRCLRRLPADLSEFIYRCAHQEVRQVACHRHGCCVLQRCLDYGEESRRQLVASSVAEAAPTLANDPYGNYAVQYALRAGPLSTVDQCLSSLQGRFPELAVEKFSSNVVERCLEVASSQWRETIVRELLNSPLLPSILSGPYGNFVAQSCLRLAHDSLRSELLAAVQPHLPSLRQSSYGRRVLLRLERL